MYQKQGKFIDTLQGNDPQASYLAASQYIADSKPQQFRKRPAGPSQKKYQTGRSYEYRKVMNQAVMNDLSVHLNKSLFSGVQDINHNNPSNWFLLFFNLKSRV